MIKMTPADDVSVRAFCFCCDGLYSFIQEIDQSLYYFVGNFNFNSGFLITSGAVREDRRLKRPSLFETLTGSLVYIEPSSCAI